MKDKIMAFLTSQNDIIPDEYDGSYELERETVKAFERMSDRSILTINDLNLAYLMCIGTWRHSMDKKKEAVDNSSLPYNEKEHLKKVIDSVWDNAINNKYENSEPGTNISVGMFGTGFYSFKGKAEDKDAKAFIEMCIDISNCTDDEDMFDRAEKVFSDGFKGMRSASASVVLHCLKPLSFPIFNANMGHQNVYKALGLKVKSVDQLKSYIHNCREVKAFRDANVTIKNYRVFDIAAQQLTPVKHKYGVFDSWEIISEEEATIVCDESFFDSIGSVVPSYIRWFFDADEMDSNERIDFQMRYEGEEYDAYITKDIYNSGSTRIFWNTDLKNKFEKYRYAPGALKLRFHRIENGLYEVGFNSKPLELPEINCSSLLTYLKSYGGLKYKSPEKVSGPELDKVNEIKAQGQNAIKVLKDIGNACSDTYGPFDVDGGSWLDGSHTKVREYLWAQLKYPEYRKSPESISIFVEEDEDTNEPRFRVSLEIKDTAAKQIDYERHYRALELPLDTDNNFKFFLGGNNSDVEYGATEITDPKEIKQRLDSGEIQKVQISCCISQEDTSSNRELLKLIVDAVGNAKKYYEHVMTGNNTNEKGYWPSLQEYDPGLSKEDYKRCLSDPSIVPFDYLDTIYRIYQLGYEATCKQIAKVYGNTPSHYNINSQIVAKRIAKETKCSVREDESGKRYWTVLYVGREAESDEEGAWVWKLREPLRQAVDELNKSSFFNKINVETEKTMNQQFGKNMILYGPPGTGKTYYSVIYAVSVCTGESIESLQEKEYSDVLAQYNELKDDNRIAFTTFHQSYGYEEFIEGIKPVLGSGESETTDLLYKIEPGVFKRICEQAQNHGIVFADGSIMDTKSIVWKISLGGARENEIKRDCFENGRIRIGWNDVDAEIAEDTEFPNDTVERMLKSFAFEMEPGDIVTVLYDQHTIDAVGIVTGDYEWLEDADNYKRSRAVNWLAKDVRINVHDIGCNKRLSEMTLYKLACDSEKLLKQAGVSIEENIKNYVIIIDEINRGNISKIFGELITLIEESKRDGAKEAMNVILPYSGEQFSVPSNVYIIGTMNTADRSIALMDTALRRRFDFIEMMPEPDVLRKLHADKVGELDVAAMLETINKRIEFLYDREHTIGHAFFTSLKEDPSIESLSLIFKKKIIPLLQEYFYEDYGKIMLVLGDSGKSEDKYKFIVESKSDDSLFKGNPDIDLEDLKYEINKDAFDELESYKQI